jgi:hypothetical protein
MAYQGPSNLQVTSKFTGRNYERLTVTTLPHGDHPVGNVTAPPGLRCPVVVIGAWSPRGPGRRWSQGEPDLGEVIAEIHHQVADLLGGPRAVRVRGHAQQVHGPSADLQHDEHGDPLEPHRGSPRGRSRRPASLTPGCAGTAALSCRCPGPAPEVSATAGEHGGSWRLPRGDRAGATHPGFAGIPSGDSPRPALDQHDHSVLDGWTPDAVWRRPFRGDQAPVPAQDRARGDQSMPPQHLRQPSGERGEHRSIRPVQAAGCQNSATRVDLVFLGSWFVFVDL